jgi:carbon storage regulator CsrA
MQTANVDIRLWIWTAFRGNYIGNQCSGSSILQSGWHAVESPTPEIMPVEKQEAKMLVLTRRAGESIKVGNITITVTRTGKSSVRIGINAPSDVRILRDDANVIEGNSKESTAHSRNGERIRQ